MSVRPADCNAPRARHRVDLPARSLGTGSNVAVRIGDAASEVSVIRWESGEGSRREARGSEMWFKATASTTQGRFSLMERTLPPGGRMPPPHSHVGNDEAYFVLGGKVEFRVAGDVFEGSNGTFVLVPAGETHTFGNTGDEPARLLVFHAPALDRVLRGLGAAVGLAHPPGPRRGAGAHAAPRHGAGLTSTQHRGRISVGPAHPGSNAGRPGRTIHRRRRPGTP